MQQRDKGKAMESCQDFEVAIGMRLAVALARDQQQALDAHLDQCALCRAFRDLAKRTDVDMTQQASMHLGTISWDALFARTQAHLKRRAREGLTVGWLTAALLVLGFSLIWRGGGDFAHGIWTGLLFGATCVTAVAGIGMWKARTTSLALQTSNPGELLATYQRGLEEQLQFTKWLPLGLAVQLLLVLSLLRVLLGAGQGWFGLGVVLCVFGGCVAYQMLWRRPQLRKELDALKADTASK